MQYTVCADSKHLKRGKEMAGGAFADGAALKRAHLYEYKTTSYLVSIYLWLLMSHDPYIYVLSIYIHVNLSIQYDILS
jgi:hypothetical protein